jgi:hypothetical protein
MKLITIHHCFVCRILKFGSKHEVQQPNGSIKNIDISVNVLMAC